MTIYKVFAVIFTIITYTSVCQSAQNVMKYEEYFDLGYALFEKGENEAAVANFNKALKFNPNHDESLFYRSAAYGMIGIEFLNKEKYHDAVDYFTKSIADNNAAEKLNPAFKKLMELKEAEKILTKMIAMSKNIVLMEDKARKLENPSLVIIAGKSVGDIQIGQSASEVEKIISTMPFNQPKDLTIHYDEKNTVDEIFILSNKFYTPEEISVDSTLSEFLKRFPASIISCTVDAGADGGTFSKIYNSFESGIMMKESTLYGGKPQTLRTISIRSKGTSPTLYGSVVVPCD